MKYTSTRDATKFYSFEEALFSGYAPDGGLFVPENLPDPYHRKSKQDVLVEVWPKLGYTDLATEILHPFIGDEGISKEDLRSLLTRALAGFDVPDTNLVPIVPMIRKSKNKNKNATDGAENGNRKETGNHVDCYVAELFHGPTYCFKDLGMRATVFLLEYFASRNINSSSSSSSSSNHAPQQVVLTAATTGDTGPAAVRAVEELDSPFLGIVVHYPEGQISDFQRRQMTTVVSDRVEIVSFDGGGDDMDRPIKNIMTTKPKQKQKTQHPNTEGSGGNDNGNGNNNGEGEGDDNILVCGVNSYNIGRPLMQMVHFVWTYLRVVEHIEKETHQKIDHDNFRLDVVIPTGAMGNIAGCYMAKKLGIPFGNLCAGVNANDVTHRAFSTGRVSKPTSGEPMKPSLSDAINIQLPYNLERLLFYLTNQDHCLVRAWYDRLENGNGDEPGDSSIDLTEDTDSAFSSTTNTQTDTKNWLEKLQTEFRSARVTDADLCATMKRVLETYNYWIDPHTGVAFCAAEQLGYGHVSQASNDNDDDNANDDVNANRRDRDRSASTDSAVAIMATASPCKFQNAMTKALGKDKWDEYELHHFPTRGRHLKDEEEKPPTRYSADPGKTLEENQLVWEANTRALIAKLGK